jgi:hypothetical protein
MNASELEEGLEIIFDKEKNDLRTCETFILEEKKKENGFFVTYSIKNYPNSNMLKEFYYYLDNEEDKLFLVKRLEKEIIDSDEDEIKVEKLQRSPGVKTFNGLSKLCFYTLLQLGFIDQALESFINRKKRYYGIFTILVNINLEDYFTIGQLNKIYLKVNQSNPEYVITKNLLLENIRNSRLKKFDQKIKFRNVEINQDKKTVSEKIALLGFNRKYNTLLAEIDDFLNDEKHKSINSGMINNLRAFMCDLTIDVAKKISEEKNEEIPQLPNHQEIGNARKYLKLNLELTDEDDKFIDSFVDILHNEGGHAFLSEKEYFRLARNIAIEIILFVLSRYEKNKAIFVSLNR